MKLTAIGVGGAFAPISKGNSNFLMEEDGKFMMFDFGITAPYILRDQRNFDLGDIDALYLTHPHSDHVGGVEFLAFHRYFIPNKHGEVVRPRLFIHSDFIQGLWCNTLKGGLDGLHGKVAHLTDYFECFPIQKNKHFVWQGIKFTPFQTLHVNCGFSVKNSQGLFIENPKTGRTAMISGDTVFNPDGLDFLFKKSDLILHDCETSVHRSRVHANIEDLRTLSAEIRAKMWLYHYGEKVDCSGFAGFVDVGQTFEI